MRYLHFVALALWLCCCVEPAIGSAWSVDAPRVLALEVDPPEAAPGASIQLRAWAADAHGDLRDQPYQLGFCRDAKALDENRVAADSCVEGGVVRVAGDGFERGAVLPDDACGTFGPLAGPNLRPRDPDDSGGYYQPLRVATGDLIGIAMVRLHCSLPNIPFAASLELRDRARDNQNPEFDAAPLEVSGAATELEALPRDRDVRLRVHIAEGSAEDYVIYDAASASVRDRTEQLRVAWFVDAGVLALAETPVSDQADNLWHTPRDAGEVHLWLVLRDERGGVRVREEMLTVLE